MAMSKKFYYTKEELELMETKNLEKLKRQQLLLNQLIDEYSADSIEVARIINDINATCNAIMACCSHLRLCARERVKRKSV